MICRARELNNEGVSLLQSGRYPEAISSFKAAFDVASNTIEAEKAPAKDHGLQHFSLKWVKVCGTFNVDNDRSKSPLNIVTRRNRTISRQVQRRQERPHQKDSNQEQLNQSMSFRSRPSQYNQIQEIHSDKLKRKKGSSHSRSFVYKRALTMDQFFEDRLSLQKSAIILFNLALASHLLALTGGPGKTKLLKMALTVYGRASNFLRVNTGGDEAFSKKTTAFHVVALNNVGQIYHALGQFKAATSCFRHVSAALDTMEDRDAIDGRERDGILLNIMTLKQPVLASAA